MEPILRILHLEDDPVDSELTRELLIKGGLEPQIDRVDTLAAFIEALERQAYALILSDYTIPGVNALEALHLAHQMRPDIPFVFLSGTIGEELAIESLKMGATDYVLKQRLQRLLPAIRRALQEAEEQARRKQAEEALREANRRKDEFLAMLAHELRNPLAPIRNAVQVLRMRGTPEPTLARQHDIIERQTTHLAHLLDDLLDVSRITRGTIELRKRPMLLADVLAQAVETAAPLNEARRQTLTTELPIEPVGLEADPDRLVQVVTNLLTNASKYTPEGGQIWLEGAHEGDSALIRVRDTGVGIAPEILPRIFDLFAQADQGLARSIGGIGIGLTIVKRLVEMHGGTVEARSEGLGRGSEFTVRLPALRS